jgi:hypothetical protein
VPRDPRPETPAANEEGSMSKYAANTEVSAARSRNEIEQILTRYNARAFAYGWQGHEAQVMFEMADRRIRFVLPMPDRADKAFTRTETGRDRSSTAAEKAYEQAVRQRWRALALVIKAKLEAVEAQISTVEDEFGMCIVLPDGRTVGDAVIPQIAECYRLGTLAPMLALTAGGP